MSTLLKVIMFSSPLLALVIYLTIVQTQKTETRFDMATDEFVQEWQSFDSEFDAFMDKQKEKRKKELELAEVSEHKEHKKRLKQEEKKFKQIEREFERAFEEYREDLGNKALIPPVEGK